MRVTLNAELHHREVVPENKGIVLIETATNKRYELNAAHSVLGSASEISNIVIDHPDVQE